MEGQSGLLQLLGGVALLLWATRLVRTGVERALGERLRAVIGGATQGRLRAAATGMGVAALLQSGTAASLLAGQFAKRGLITLPMALAVVLGADVGSTLAVKILSYDLRALAPAFLFAGFVLFTWLKNPALRNAGRALIGLALILMALGMIALATAPLRGDTLAPLVLQRLEAAPLVALLVAALFTLAVQSSVAVVLLVITLAATGAVGAQLSLLLVLGANVGSALVALWTLWGEGLTARRMAVGNLAFRGLTALLLVPFLPKILLLAGQANAGGALVANAHIAFNLLVAVVWLPLTGLAAGRLELWIKPPAAAADAQKSHLDDAALAHPTTAIAAASREALRIADRIELMLREVMLTFDPGHIDRVAVLRRIDDEVDREQEAIKLYLTRLTRQPLSEEDSRKAFDLILFATNLEHVGDIIDKNLLELAQKKHRLQASFSPEGLAELKALHETAVRQAQMAVTVFLTRDADMARQLVDAKDAVRLAEKTAAENHLQRLRQGHSSSIETSSLHLDVLRDLKRIVAHLTSVAYPILEASGQLRSSRLS
jgi:phosphate:Na+ symporter